MNQLIENFRRRHNLALASDLLAIVAAFGGFALGVLAVVA